MTGELEDDASEPRLPARDKLVGDDAVAGTGVPVDPHHAASGALPPPTHPLSKHLAPFSPPVLAPTRMVGSVLIGLRLLLTMWAYGLGVVMLLAPDDASSVIELVDAMTALGAVIAVAWLALATTWSVRRTQNVHILDGRYPTVGRAARAWVYPAVWIVLMTLTLVQLEPSDEFDVRPAIIVVGFLASMTTPYRLVQRIFRSLVRVVPDAAIMVIGVVDTIAVGLLWWRLATFPRGADSIDPNTVDLLGGLSFAAGIALSIGLALTAYLEREADASEDLRLLALRTRYDHRLARLQGLDPMDPATRWALWLARQRADRLIDMRAEPDRAADAVTANDAAGIAAAAGSTARDPLARALQRTRSAAARAQHKRSWLRFMRRRRSNDGAPAVAEALTQWAEELASTLGEELDRGGTGSFADHVLELSRQYQPISPQRRPAEPHDVEVTEADVAPPRVVVAELLRYLSLVMLGLAALACVWILVGAGRDESAARLFAPDHIERARVYVVYGVMCSNALVLWWLAAAAWYTGKLDPTVRWQPRALTAGVVGSASLAAAFIDRWDAGPTTSVTLLAGAMVTVIGLYLLPVLPDAYGIVPLPTNAWTGTVVATQLLLLVTPFRSGFGDATSESQLAFAATVIGLTLITGGVLAALTMSGYENVLRSSYVLARLRGEKLARSRGRRGSRQQRRASRRSG